MSVGILPKQLGYMLIQDGAIAKSEGDLVNAERLATVVLRMIAVGPFFAPSVAQANAQINASGDEGNEFNRLTVLFSDHQYDIVIGNNAGGISIGGGRQTQHQKQTIHVVKRTLPISE
ncbi:hypothetical protein niasHT_024310 [Heterodera trifolii]|uniref:Uncharacterized protein n=1 Tax=Heterodera trifolii TaxID=157864 RepID=A0ABD2JM93_9BILA